MATQDVLLKAQVRESGSNRAAKVRKQDKIPAIIYGHKEEPIAIAFDRHDFVEALHHGHRVMDVELDGKKGKLLVKDLQYDHLGKDVIHADLIRVSLTEKVQVQVPVELKGTAAGAAEGGIIDEHLNQIEVECLVTNIPELIEISVKEIQVGDSIHAKDVSLPAGVKMITDPEALIATCHLVAAAKSTEELEEEAPTMPEVIGEEKEEADSGEEQAKE